MTHFIFDCDDVLLDWKAGFLDWLDPDGTKIDRAGPKSWCLAEWLHCSQKEAAMWVREFNASERFGQLKARPGARDLLTALHYAGHKISLLTACGDERPKRFARYGNIRDALGYELLGALTDNVHFLPLGGSKFKHLYEFTRSRDPGDVVFVEDNFEHAKSGVANGIRSYCLRRSHNRQQEAENPDTKVIWIDDLDAIRLDFIPAIQPNVDYATRRESCKPSSKSTSAASGLGPVSLSAQQSSSPALAQSSQPLAPVSAAADRCNRCGTALKAESDGWSDCPRCQGSY